MSFLVNGMPGSRFALGYFSVLRGGWKSGPQTIIHLLSWQIWTSIPSLEYGQLLFGLVHNRGCLKRPNILNIR